MNQTAANSGSRLSARFITALRESGLRVTTQRRRIVSAIIGLERPAKVEDIRRLAELKPAQLVTVYRTVEKLFELELVRKLHTDNGTQLFMVNPDVTCQNHDDHASHPSLLCRECHRSFPLPPVSQAFMAEVADTAARLGFSALKVSLEFTGLCPQCRE